MPNDGMGVAQQGRLSMRRRRVCVQGRRGPHTPPLHAMCLLCAHARMCACMLPITAAKSSNKKRHVTLKVPFAEGPGMPCFHTLEVEHRVAMNYVTTDMTDRRSASVSSPSQLLKQSSIQKVGRITWVLPALLCLAWRLSPHTLGSCGDAGLGLVHVSALNGSQPVSRTASAVQLLSFGNPNTALTLFQSLYCGVPTGRFGGDV